MRRLSTIAPLLAVVAVLAAFLAPQLFGGKVASTARLAEWAPWAAYEDEAKDGGPSFNPDYLTSYYPRRAVLHQAWRERELPFWNPYTFCGTPFLADPQAQALYPPSWLLLPLDPAHAHGVFLFLHLAGAGAGMALLLRRRDVGTEVAVLGGIAFALSGFFAKHLGLPPFLATAAWLPWVLLATEDVVDRPGKATAAKLALAGSFTFLAGQPQIALLVAYAAAGAAAVRLVVNRAGRGHVVRAALALGAAGILAALVISAQLLPTLELASRSARAKLPFETVVSGALHPVETIRFLVPDFFGSPLMRDEWSGLFPRGDSFYGRIQLNSVFAGTPVFLLALLGMVHPRTWRRALPFTVIFVVAALVTFGAPLVRLAHAVLPGFSIARLDRAGSIVVFAQFVPAALAAAQLRRVARWPRRVTGALLIAAAALGTWAVPALGPDLPAALGAGDSLSAEAAATVVARTPARTATAALFAAGAGLALLIPAGRIAAALPFVLAVVQLFLWASPYRGDREPEAVFASTPGIEALRESLDGPGGGYRFVRFGRDGSRRAAPASDVLPPSTNVPHRLRDLQGYNALVDRRLGDLLERVTGEPLFSTGIWSGRRIVAPSGDRVFLRPVFSALSVREIVSSESLARPDVDRRPPAPGFARGGVQRPLPRIRLTASGRGVSDAELLRSLSDPAFGHDPSVEVLWPGEGSAGTPGSSPAPPEVLAETRNRLLVRTNSETEVLLVVADSYDAGWRATIDGRPAPIRAAWGVARAITVPAGAHRIEMVYSPPGFRIGAVLSLLGVSLALAALAVSRPVATATRGT